LLFVCGASKGGAFRSTLELARALERRGHSTQVLVEAADVSIRARVAERLLDAEVKIDRVLVTGVLGPLRRRIGARAGTALVPSRHLVSPVPENAAAGLARKLGADAVIVSSIRRPAWRQIRNWCRTNDVLSVLYMRGMSELDQLDHGDGKPDLLLSNTRSVAELARRSDHVVTFVPSLVDLSGSATETTREVALLVSPTEIQGVDTALMLAAARPDVRFVLQHSWSLDAIDTERLNDRLARLSNVEQRSTTSTPAEIYRDARILVVPHRIDNRPRVILEAQSNGIPVLVRALPGLLDQMGDGGLAVEDTAEPDDWIGAFARLWDDEATYAELSTKARQWAARPEQSEESIIGRFEAIIEEAIDRPMD
jgi:glycosyltransferase involved in cell wall biosynthesis